VWLRPEMAQNDKQPEYSPYLPNAGVGRFNELRREK
jgi:hypothetical protein